MKEYFELLASVRLYVLGVLIHPTGGTSILPMDLEMNAVKF